MTALLFRAFSRFKPQSGCTFADFPPFPKVLISLLTGLVAVLVAAPAFALTPNYVQGNSAVPLTPQTKVAVSYTSAQSAGNLNVVVVGWRDATTHISSLSDSKGNIYHLAVGPTILTGATPLSLAVYYAIKVLPAAANANVVTVTFNSAAASPDIRISEYSGVSTTWAIDVSAAATGNSATSSGGSVITTGAVDLLVSANVASIKTTAPGSGFVQRMITSPNGNILEDRVVTAVGSYNSTASLTAAGPWLMQIVAFHAAVSATTTPTPTPTPTPPPTPIVTTAPVLATPTYIQGNSAVPQTAVTTVPVAFTSAQVAGHLNCVVVGWNDATSQITSLTDTKGNLYQLAVGPTILTGATPLTQSVYYAKNIVAATAGANIVTVKFNAAATYADVRILEYSGIDPVTPVDVVVAATGNSAATSSGTVMTVNPQDMLVGSNLVWTGTTGPGSGMTQRLLTNPNGDIAEDRLVTTVGSYSATAPLSSAGPWMMHMVAFRAAGSPAPSTSPTPTPTPVKTTPTPIPPSTPTPTPKATITPTPTPIGSATPTPTATPIGTATPTPTVTPVTSPGPAPSVALAWNTNIATGQTTTNTVGYRLHYGFASGVYTQTTDLGNATAVTVPMPKSGTKYFFIVTAYNSAAVESTASNEISITTP
jgi:hypothetical protein